MTSSLSQIQIFQRYPITIYRMFTNQTNTSNYGQQNNHNNPSQNLQPSNYNNLYYQHKQPNTNIDLEHPQTKSAQELIQRARKIYGKNRLIYQRQQKTRSINNNRYFKALATADNYPYNKSIEKAYLKKLDSKQFLESMKKSVSNILPFIPNKSQKIPEKAASKTQILPKIQNHPQQNILDFLYKFFGILSSHIRLKQRYVLYRLIEKSHQLKPVKNFNQIFINTQTIINRRLQNVFNILKNLKINIHLYINNNMKNKQDYKKIQRLDEHDPNFIMLESEVEKGLKYLQQRSDRRQKEISKQYRSGNNFQKQQTYNEYNENHNKNYQYYFPYSVNNKNIVSAPNIQNNNPTLKFNNYKSLKKIPSSQNIKRAQSQAFKKENKKEEKILQNQDIYLRLQRESKINSYRTPQWLALDMNDQPLDNKNKKQIFSRVQLNQRKYYLNPNLFIGSQPDTNNFIMPLQLNQEYQLHGIQTSLQAYKKLTQMTAQPNIPQDNIFISYPNNIQNFKQQNYLFKNENDKNQRKLTNIKFDNQSLIKNQLNQHEFDNLPSFAQKNKAMMKNQKQNQIKKDIFQNQHTKSDQMGNKIIDKQQQNSFKISEGEDPDHLNDCLLVDSDRKKINKIQQYYTDNNIKSQKNKGARVTIQFSKPRKTKKTTARPKSMTTSLRQQQKVSQENPLYKSIQQNAKIAQQSDQQTPKTTNKTQTQETNSPNFCKNKVYIDSKSPANIKFITPTSSSFSPIYQTNVTFSNKKIIINNEYGNLQQTKFVTHQPIQHDTNLNQAILNKPARSVSSEARFVQFYGNPIKYSTYNQQRLQNSIKNNIIQQPKLQIIQNHPQQIHYVNSPTNNIGYGYRIQRQYPYFPNSQHPQQYIQQPQQNPQISYKPFTPTTLTQTRPPAISLMHYNQRSPCQSKINKKRKGIEVKSIQKQLLCSKSQKTLQINTQKPSQGQMISSITNLRKIKLITSQYS